MMAAYLSAIGVVGSWRRCRKNQQQHWEGGVISALYNLIHGFIYSDESMTDIQ